jgi:hypothetical protein
VSPGVGNAATPTPEPGSAVLLMLGCLFVGKMRGATWTNSSMPQASSRASRRAEG